MSSFRSMFFSKNKQTSSSLTAHLIDGNPAFTGSSSSAGSYSAHFEQEGGVSSPRSSFMNPILEPEVHMNPMDLLFGGGSFQHPFTTMFDVQQNSGPKLTTLTVQQVQHITGNFSKLRIMIEKDSWSVFKGEFSGKPVAVHKILTNSEELDSMAKKMQSVSHDHAAKAIAWCPENGCIVVEILKGKSLREKLSDGIRWQDRCRIAVDIASAVEYLIDNEVAVNGIDSAAISLDKSNTKSKLIYSIAGDRMDKQSSFEGIGLLFLELLTTSSNKEVLKLSSILQTSKKPTSLLIERIGSRVGTWPEDVLTAFVSITITCLNASRQKMNWKTLAAELAHLGKLVTEAEKNSKKSPASSSSSSGNVPPPKLGIHDLLDGIHLVTLDQLAAATNNFSPTNVIGKGGFGVVYRGRHQGVEVAVKKLHSNSNNGALTAEVQILHSLRHHHILSLYAFEPTTPCLVSEYMAGGSLDSWLKGRQGNLTWLDKVRICREMSAAVLYMHERNIVHRDLKLPNVLLDEHKRSKICDLGLAKAYIGDYTNMSQMQGTSGYIDPHILNTGFVSAHSDTYALGLIIMQVLTGICHIHDLHRLYDKFKKQPVRKDLASTLDDLNSEEDIPIPAEEAAVADSRWDLRPGKFSVVVEHFCKYLDPRSRAMPKDALEKTVGILLRCVERKWEFRARLEDLLIALEELEARSKEVDAEYLSGPVIPIDEQCDEFSASGFSGKSPSKFESKLSDIKAEIDARASCFQEAETSLDAKFLVAIQKRQKLTRKMVNAITKLKLLESQFAEALGADKVKLSKMIELAEREAKASVDEATAAEEEYDSFLIRDKENIVAESSDRVELQQLMALHKEVMEEANLVTRETKPSKLAELEILSNKEDALEMRRQRVLIEQQVIEDRVRELNVKLQATKDSKCEDQRLLVHEKGKLMEELTELQQQLNAKLTEVEACSKDILAVNEEVELLVSNFDKLKSGLQLEARRVAEDKATVDKEVENLRVQRCEVEGLKLKAEQNIQMCAEVVKIAGGIKETLEKEVEVEKRSRASVGRAIKEKLGELAVQERSLWEIQTTLQQQIAVEEDALKILDIARTKLQQDRATCQAQLTFSEKRLAELQMEKKLAASLKNFTEAARFGTDAKLLVGEIAELEEEFKVLGTQLEAMELDRNKRAMIISEMKEKLVGSDRGIATVRCEWLRLVAVVAKQEIDEAAEREEFDKAELLKMEPDLADEEADRLQEAFGLREKRFERLEL